MNEPPRWCAQWAVLLSVMAGPATAQTIIDGDTVQQGDKRWRLWGIDAPESRQVCKDGWPAGAEATAAMRKLVEG